MMTEDEWLRKLAAKDQAARMPGFVRLAGRWRTENPPYEKKARRWKHDRRLFFRV